MSLKIELNIVVFQTVVKKKLLKRLPLILILPPNILTKCHKQTESKLVKAVATQSLVTLATDQQINK